MTSRFIALTVVAALAHAAAAAQSAHRLDSAERAAVLALITAVDSAQINGAPPVFAWDHHVLKSIDATAFVPFRVTPPRSLRGSKSTVMYVRAVSRHDGIASKEERSFVRDWLMSKATEVPEHRETVFLGAGEMPVGGPATTSGRAAMISCAKRAICKRSSLAPRKS